MSRKRRESGEVLIRSGTASEIGPLLKLWRDSETRPSVTDDAAGLRRLFDRDSETVIVAEEHGGIVGVLIATFDGWRGNMYHLAVLRGHRRRGIARALVSEGESRLRSRGARRITATVAHNQAGAPELWSSAGFEADPRTTRFVKTF